MFIDLVVNVAFPIVLCVVGIIIATLWLFDVFGNWG